MAFSFDLQLAFSAGPLGAISAGREHHCFTKRKRWHRAAYFVPLKRMAYIC